MDRFSIFASRLVPKSEHFAPGHRACMGCGEALAVRHVMKVLGRNVIVANATGCLEIISSQIPQSSWEVPWIHTLFENTAAVASGIEAGIKTLIRKGRIPARKLKVVAMAGDGGTSDIGIQALSGALERGHDFLYICYDNEAYMNTGIQRSSSTPYGARTTTSPPGKKSIGQATWKKNMPAIVSAHGISYVATACPSYPFDLMDKVKRAVEVKGPTYLHILSVCPTGWRSASDLTVRLGRLAVETGMFPLYEVVEGRYRLSMDLPPLRPIRDYLKHQGRFRHLGDEEIEMIQQRISQEYHKLQELSRKNED